MKKEFKEFRSSGVQELQKFRSSGVQEFQKTLTCAARRV
jgi:hypothetical protein